MSTTGTGLVPSIGDGAGAAVVGLNPSEKLGLEIVGHSIHIDSELYGTMRLTSRADVPARQISENADGRPMFHMSSEVRDVFLNWGVNRPC